MERRLVTDAFEAGDRIVSEIMVPRTEVGFLSATMPLGDAVDDVLTRPHWRWTVGDAVEGSGHRFTVTETGADRIVRIRIEPIADAPARPVPRE